MLSTLLGSKKEKQIQGTVVLVKKKNSFDFTDVGSSLFDRASECLGRGVSIQLLSASKFDRERGAKGKIGKPAYLESWITNSPNLTAEKFEFKVHFEWEEEVGIPGAFLIKNKHPNEFFLISLTLKNVPLVGESEIHFPCNSWVYRTNRYEDGRIFFRNKAYLPDKTPDPLRRYREEELSKLRGDGIGNRELQERDRVYDYAIYNDLNNPKKNDRPILGGTIGGEIKYPYPRRGRTGRSLVQSDYESRVKFLGSNYVPRDEEFSPLKNADFVTFGFKSVTKVLKPALKASLSEEFNSFDEVLDLYEGGFKLPKALLMAVSSFIPLQKLKEAFRIDGEEFLRFQKPQVIRDNKNAWMKDEEFAREMLAGVNPVKICCLQDWPIKSKVDGTICKISEDDIQKNLEGQSVEQAIKHKKLFILDYYDDFIPYLRLINTTAADDINSKVHPRAYATRTVLLLKNDGTLKPLAIELSLPQEAQFDGTPPQVYLPAEEGVEKWIWMLAKAYVVVNDSNYHQLISHWLQTHAVVEPFVIATNRQLSVIHPINKLLAPHFNDTMKINALARQSLVNANGIIESTFLPGRYSMEFSSKVYKDWVFTDQALPVDLLKRGMATEDSTSPHGLNLAIKDYPYAVDGLDIWFAIKTWVQEYCSFYYEKDDTVQQDNELQSWWKELVQVGHGDKKDYQSWPKMKNRKELIECCTIIIWITSGLHAAVNFGQYPFGGYILNRPTFTGRYMPQKGTSEYEELKTNPEKAFLRTINSKDQAIKVTAVLAILSRHSATEEYLGQAADLSDWISDKEPLAAFGRFKERIRKIEERIERDNKDVKLKNRHGPINMPYTLLYPNSEPGLTGKGIPNSISI
ncbi:hypothetical protein K1719_024097 [Acacia pycnantha]|nr:hypothetical protein K1719_024097 [Acacia pycnantha]